jgi:hypothetical protein
VVVGSKVVILKSVGSIVVILVSIEVVSTIVVVVTGGAVVISGQPGGTFGTHRFRVLVPGCRVLPGLRVLVPGLRVLAPGLRVCVLVPVRVPFVTVLSLPVFVTVLVLFDSVLVSVPRVHSGLLPLVLVVSVGHSAIVGQVHTGCGGHVLGGGQVGSKVLVSFADCAFAKSVKHISTPANSKIVLVFMIVL